MVTATRPRELRVLWLKKMPEAGAIPGLSPAVEPRTLWFGFMLAK